MILGTKDSDIYDRKVQWTQRFAYFPTHLDDGRWVWCERYWQRGVFHLNWPSGLGTRWIYERIVERPEE